MSPFFIMPLAIKHWNCWRKMIISEHQEPNHCKTTTSNSQLYQSIYFLTWDISFFINNIQKPFNHYKFNTQLRGWHQAPGEMDIKKRERWGESAPDCQSFQNFQASIVECHHVFCFQQDICAWIYNIIVFKMSAVIGTCRCAARSSLQPPNIWKSETEGWNVMMFCVLACGG